MAKDHYRNTGDNARNAFAGWNGDPCVSNADFVIAAYQASQITSLGVNAVVQNMSLFAEETGRVIAPVDAGRWSGRPLGVAN